MPVTTHPNPSKIGSNKDCPAEDLLGRPGRIVLHSSFKHVDPTSIIPYKNGFVNGIIRAWQQELHLVLRPDDVWLSIVTQFSIYVVAHAEELRSKFVAHEGKQTLLLELNGSFDNLDVGHMARGFTALMEEFLTNKEIRDWVIPHFSTTTHDDITVSSIAMMATMQEYFEYYATFSCGLPSVTLLGEVEDWEKMLDLVHQLPQYGEGAAEWSKLLIPVLTRFVETFKNPNDQAIKDFWEQGCYAERGRGSGQADTFSGWITAFTNWDGEGRLNRASGYDTIEKTVLELDGVKYPIIEQTRVSTGLFEVPVIFFAEGVEYDTTIRAGSMGVELRKYAEKIDEFQPKSGWWVMENETKPLDMKKVKEVYATANKK